MSAPTRDALIADFSTRRPDAVLPTVTSQPRTLRPFAARLHRLAAFITEHELPEAGIAVGQDSVVVLVHDGLIQNTVRQYAQALDLLVLEEPFDMPDGTAGTRWSAVGYGPDCRTWWSIEGCAPVPAVTR